MIQWYEELFSNFAEQYDKEEFVQGTSGEVDFIEAEINNDRTCRILDIGCGTGRHSIELSRRGYSVVGIDLSEPMLARAKLKAHNAGVKVEFIRADARHLQFFKEFDLAIMLCEGAFPLMETDEMNYMILRSAVKALKDRGKFIFTTLSALFPLFHSVKDLITKNVSSGQSSYNSFDLMTFRESSKFEFLDDGGNSKSVQSNERYYAPSEVSWLLKSLDFITVHICGCRIGAFNRNDSLTPENLEMLVVAQR